MTARIRWVLLVALVSLIPARALAGANDLAVETRGIYTRFQAGELATYLPHAIPARATLFLVGMGLAAGLHGRRTRTSSGV